MRARRAQPPRGCLAKVLWSFDTYPAEYFFVAASLVGLSIIIVLISLVTSDIPACWLPRPFPRGNTTASNSTRGRSHSNVSVPAAVPNASLSPPPPPRRCIPKIIHVVRRTSDEKDFAFSEWLSLRSLGTWLDSRGPELVVLYVSQQPQGKWFERLLSSGPLHNRTALVLTPHPLRARAAGLAARGGIIWDTAEFAVMSLAPLMCTTFDSIASWDPRISKANGLTDPLALQAIVLSHPGTPFARDLVQLETAGTPKGCTTEACKARLLAHRHWETTLALPGLAFFPEASTSAWRLFGSTWTYRWGTSYGLSLAAHPKRLRQLAPCSLITSTNTNIRAVLRPVVWESFFRGELPELHDCPMTIDWSAISTPRPN